MVLHERAPELDGVSAGRFRKLFDETLKVDAVLVRVHAAPRPDRHVRVAHRVLGAQVRHRVADLRVARRFPQTLQLAQVLAVLDAAGAR